MLKDLFDSKKFRVLLIGIVLNILLYFDVLKDLDATSKQELILSIDGLIAVFILGQGIADHGKEAAKVQVAAKKEKKK